MILCKIYICYSQIIHLQFSINSHHQRESVLLKAHFVVYSAGKYFLFPPNPETDACNRIAISFKIHKLIILWEIINTEYVSYKYVNKAQSMAFLSDWIENEIQSFSLKNVYIDAAKYFISHNCTFGKCEYMHF